MYLFYNQMVLEILNKLNISCLYNEQCNEKLDEYLFKNNFINEDEYLKIKSYLLDIPIKKKEKFKRNIDFINVYKKDFYEKHNRSWDCENGTSFACGTVRRRQFFARFRGLYDRYSERKDQFQRQYCHCKADCLRFAGAI